MTAAAISTTLFIPINDVAFAAESGDSVDDLSMPSDEEIKKSDVSGNGSVIIYI
jgi:hypothetical protein